MTKIRVALFLAVFATSFAVSATAQAGPRLVFKGCAYWSLLPPFCLKMKATNGTTY